MRFVNWISLVTALTLSALSFADDDVIVTDDKGRRWTDLHILAHQEGGRPRPPKLDLQTLKNAKLTCKAKGARLPEISHLNQLADFLGRQYLLTLEAGNPEVIDARFMRDSRYFWTSTVRKEGDRFVYNRALARLSTVTRSNDISKADVIYKTAAYDDYYRPFLCMYEAPTK